MVKRNASAVEERLAALARRRWSVDREGLSRLSHGSGADEIVVYARRGAADALVETLSEAADELTAAHAELDTLRTRVADLEDEASARDAGGKSAAKASARKPATLEDVPAALIAPFHPSPRTLETAKKDPLTALAVQAAKAMQADAKELDRARLLAMAFAASEGDMQRFWEARAQRSAKKAARR
jgi:hypothetical protein